ncbi:hypothetical protein AURDEDRAFT_111219 [Auricularia subglabra TFB-10046 SS5]|nr:hypothetical protein AURDEDRAFT_111219 [Auricularia subglabra TFB-10046 SS5]
MAALTAAELQRRRQELEGAPDPFPALPGAEPVARHAAHKQAPAAATAQLDTDDSQAFPALAPAPKAAPTPAKAPAPGWGAGPRITPPVSRLVTDTFELDVVDLSIAGKDGKRAASLSEVLRNVNAKFKVKTEASQQPNGYTLFTLKGDSQKDLDKARKQLIALLSPQITLTVNAPVSTIAAIIGPKGAFLKSVRDETGAKIDIPPRRDGAAIPNGKPANEDDDEQEEETVPITITAAGVGAREAKRLIEEVITVRTSKTTQRVRDVPAHILPFIAGRKADFEALATEVTVTVNGNDVHVAGNREGVATIVEAIKAGIEELKGSLMTIKMPLPRRQHRLLTGKAAEEILNKSKCSVQLPKVDADTDEISLWARPADLPGALAAVQQAAASQYVQSFNIPGKHAQALQIFNYLSRTGFSKTVSAAHPGVTLHAPTQKELTKDPIAIDIVGDKAAADAAVKQLAEATAKLVGATREAEIDWLVHRAVSGKYAKKIKAFQDAQHVAVFWPAEALESNKVLIVYDPNADPKDRKANLDEVEKELLKFAKDVADVKTEVISVDAKWHPAILGKNGTTLNAIIGAESTLAIKLGKDASRLLKAEGQATSDTIAVRGVASDVARAIKDIHGIVEAAKNDEIDNGYTVEFHIPREYVGRIVGAQGQAVNKLRESLGIEVDFTDEDDGKEKEKENGIKKKKPTSSTAKARVTLKGRKENVEEAKRRILAQVERLADETAEILKIPRQYHASLIGRGAKYVVRLEEKYAVKITFPRESDENGEGKTREQLKSDEVLVKGGKKGVADTKKELMDAVEYEKEQNNALKFTVPTRSVPRILGKAGSQINEIKDATGAQIDIDKADDGAITNVTVRGSKTAIVEAKAAILRIASEVDDEVTETIKIESRFHRTIIGARGQGLKDLIVKCGGPTDPKAQAGLAHFPRQGETSDEVTLRGPKAIVAKLKAELEKIAADLRDRVVLGVSIPAPQHRALIGRGGQTLTALQEKHGVQVQFPGSRSYGMVGEPDNLSELTDVDAADLVKVSGRKKGAEAAIKEMLSHTKNITPASERQPAVGNGQASGPIVEETVEVPVKYHHAISQGGQFFRGLRSYGVNVDHSVTPPKPSAPRPSGNGSQARIDDAEEAGKEIQWEIGPNYAGADDAVATWTLKARDQAGLDRAKKAVEDAIKHAEQASHVGFLTVSDRSAFPRIVGSKGANVARLRAETGAEITVGRDDNIITLVGSESAVLAAKDAVLEIVNSKPRPRSGN